MRERESMEMRKRGRDREGLRESERERKITIHCVGVLHSLLHRP